MFIVKKLDGSVVAKIDSTRHTLNQIKGVVRRDERVFYRFPVTKVVDTQLLHHKDKVSRVRGKVASARVGGQHSALLVHTMETGEFKEERVW